MKAAVTPTKEFRPPSVSWVRRDSVSSPSKESRPPSVSWVIGDSTSSPSKESRPPSVSWVIGDSVSSPSKESRPPSVSWVRRDSVSSPSKQYQTENSTSSTVTNNNQSHEIPLQFFPIDDRKSAGSIINEQRPMSINHSNNIRSAESNSKKNFDEKEDNLSVMTPTNQPRISWVRKNRSARIVGDRNINSRMERLHGEDFTPLNNINNDRNSSTSGTMTYHFHPSGTITNVYETETNQKQKKRRISPWFNQYSCCFIKAFATFFVLAALAVGIAALVFAIIAYIRSLPTQPTTHTTTTTTTTSTSTSTTSTSSTSTTTSSSSTTTSTSTTTTTTTLTTSTATQICPGGGNFATMTSAPILSPYCTTYTNISDATRLTYYQDGGTSCDDIVFPTVTWVRFIGGSGSLLANCPVPYRSCGATAPGWYSGQYPATIGGMATGTVCFNWGTNSCTYNSTIQVINCNGFYVFELSPPPICDARYCTL